MSIDQISFLERAARYEDPTIEEKWQRVVDDVKDEYLSHTQHFPWIVGFSGGKDSTVVAHAVFEALLDIPPSRRSRPVHIVSNDTRVESPLVMSHLDDVTARISMAAESMGLPIKVARTQPDPDKTFWALLIGKGYTPLVAFRDWLKGIRNDPQMRQAIRRNGKLTFAASGKHIPGPFTIQARQEILKRLLQVQEKFGAELISNEELELIYQTWATELQQETGAGNG
ncbi:hypothetical protein [uncultured Reyranella sp.]|uniref:hypothetical protein n=1 Tax=uncultured Reyranella sp. TaxID=735512 RepID=UPI0025D2A203|nr:hypothetical protein [uncultured Reyranella sp.]